MKYIQSKKRKNTTHLMKTQKKKPFKKMNCSPAVYNQSISTDSCLTPIVLQEIKAKYNKKHNKTPIIENDPKKILERLKDNLNCSKEECFLNQLDDENVKQQLKSYIFAPKHPEEWNKNPKEWLSNYDILDVLKQYELSYPNFKFIGPTTIDFDTKLPEKNGSCVLDDLCTFSLEKIIDLCNIKMPPNGAFMSDKDNSYQALKKCEGVDKQKDKIGIVFNLDKHYESGSHWVSMFIDIENKFIFYFDSADNPIPPEITTLVNRISSQGKELETPIHFNFYSNRGFTHQTGNSECGMYSLFFIITMLTKKTSPSSKKLLSQKSLVHLFTKKRIPDHLVFQHRKIYFND